MQEILYGFGYGNANNDDQMRFLPSNLKFPRIGNELSVTYLESQLILLWKHSNVYQEVHLHVHF